MNAKKTNPAIQQLLFQPLLLCRDTGGLSPHSCHQRACSWIWSGCQSITGHIHIKCYGKYRHPNSPHCRKDQERTPKGGEHTKPPPTHTHADQGQDWNPSYPMKHHGTQKTIISSNGWHVAHRLGVNGCDQKVASLSPPPWQNRGISPGPLDKVLNPFPLKPSRGAE